MVLRDFESFIFVLLSGGVGVMSNILQEVYHSIGSRVGELSLRTQAYLPN